MGYLTWFARDMIAGRGMIAMSAMNIAAASRSARRWRRCCSGTADALSNYMQLGKFPSELISMFPYVCTVAILVLMAVIRTIKATAARNRI